jgi:phage FluMu gp28-like protein
MSQHRLLVVNKSRQMGLSTCEAIFALWFAAMHPNKTVVIMSSKLVAAFEIIARIRYAAESMPAHLLPNVTASNKGTIEFDNGSRILGRACSIESIRGMGISMLILDEFAYVSHTKAYEFVSAMMPIITANKSSKIIMTSTPGVPDGPFFDIWRDALNEQDANGVGVNGFAAMTLPWTMHPNRDEAWAKPFRDSLGEARFAQEFENKFVR